MNFRHTVTALLAAGTLTAATAVPAMALENEFHGMFRLKGFLTNFNNGKFLEYDPAGADAKADTKNYVEQRARLKYIAKANDDLKLVTHFEIDSRWGDNSYNSNNTTRNNGGAIGADQVNLETKSVYLDFNIPKVPVNVKLGIQPWEDAYQGIFVDADMAGLLATYKAGSGVYSLGWFRFDDSKVPGNGSRDLVVLDGAWSVSEALKVGGSYYVLNDQAEKPNRAIPKETVHMFGTSAEAKLGPATVNGFLLYQFGNLDANSATRHISAFAGSAGARAKLGPGTAKTSFLYASGEGSSSRSTTNAFQDVEDIDQGPEHDYESDMRMLRKDKFAQNTDNAIVFTINNRDQGVIFGSVGYDISFTDRLFAGVNAGFAAVAKENANKPVNLQTGSRNGSNYLGTEANAEVGYQIYDNLTARLQFAYVWLGDYYKGVAKNGADPDNPYTSRIIMQYSF
jgi:hypothetical protein